MTRAGTASQPAALPAGTGGISSRRRWLAAVVLVVGLPVLTSGLLDYRRDMSYATPVLLVLVLVVVVALIGGLWVALPSAVAGGLVLNWFFTPPFDTLAIERSDQLLALVVYLGIAIALSAIVDHAARRTAEARRARAEARELSSLAGANLAGAQSLEDLLERVRTTFRMREVSLLERIGMTWVRAATVSGGHSEPGEVELRVDAGTGWLLTATGPPLFAEDRAVLSAFAEAAATAMERRRLAEKAQVNAELEAGNRMRTALLAAVGHDLRTPLAGVKAAVSSLRQDDVEFTREERDELLETIETSADRLQALLANLLDASRLQAGVLTLHTEPTSLEDVSGRVLVALSPADRERVILDIPDDLPEATADGGLLERILANLVDNALRHSPPGPTVTLQASSEPGWVVCEVADHGPGVDPSQRSQMFEPFQRLSDRSPGGIGLGLAVARGFAEAMGGSLTPVDRPGFGLTMRLELPLAPTGEPSGAPGVSVESRR